MKKLLAVVRRTDGGFRGYVPKLPGCEIRAATAEQAEADITAAAKAHLMAGKEGTNGLAGEPVEIVVAVEPLMPEHLRGDDQEHAVERWGWQFPSDDELEAMLNPDEHKWFTFEEMMQELGFDEAEPPAAGCSE